MWLGEAGHGAAKFKETEVTVDDLGEAVPAADEAELARLRGAVHALKLEAQSAKKKEQVAVEDSPNKEPGSIPIPEQTPANGQEAKADGGYPIRMQLPKAAGEASPRTAEFAADSATITAAQDEHQLPKPSLDFEQFPGLAQEKTRLLSGTARRSLSGPIGALVAIVLLFVAAGIGAYRMGWLRWPGRKVETKAAESSMRTTPTSEVKTTGENAVPVPVPKTEKRAVNTAPRVARSATGATGDGGSDTAAESEGPLPSGNKRSNETVARNRTAAKTDVKNSSVQGTTGEEYEPPRLIKAIRSLSPPEALQAFVSGVVQLDALVDENGKVVSATPISGPKALYQKAAQTVKDGYLYQPAKRNGKPVQAHADVRIQFWYEP